MTAERRTRTARCRYCDAPIRWMQNKFGNYPCQPEKVSIVSNREVIEAYEDHRDYCTELPTEQNSEEP